MIHAPEMSRTWRYCGRTFSDEQIETIRTLIEEHPELNRARLSRLVCERLQWTRPDGQLKEMSCRVAMLRMAADALIELPPPQKGNGNGKAYARRTPRTDPQLSSVLDPAGALADLRLELVGFGARRPESHLWNEYVDRYHYLGYQPLPGAQLRYFARTRHQPQPIALLGFGAAAWMVRPRDDFIGWSARQREARLHLVVNNARFLILPWVRSHNLASRLLAMAARRLADDWQLRYGYRPVLLETFVEVPRFRATCYKAANWIHLGETRGRGKLGKGTTPHLPQKSVWVCPLLVTEVLDEELTKGTFDQSHLLFEDAGALVFAAGDVEVDAPPGGGGECSDFGEQFRGAPAKGDEGNPRLVEALEAIVGGDLVRHPGQKGTGS